MVPAAKCIKPGRGETQRIILYIHICQKQQQKKTEEEVKVIILSTKEREYSCTWRRDTHKDMNSTEDPNPQSVIQSNRNYNHDLQTEGGDGE